MSPLSCNDRRLKAYSALSWVIRQCRPLEDYELGWVLDAEQDHSARKEMVSGLLGIGLITRDQAGMQVYLRPGMKGA